MSHTPGPWKWEADRGDGTDWDCLVGPDGTTIITWWGNYCDDAGLDVRREDAPLIAAAPQLLAAVKAAIGALDPDTHPRTFFLLRAALAKAEGGE